MLGTVPGTEDSVTFWSLHSNGKNKFLYKQQGTSYHGQICLCKSFSVLSVLFEIFIRTEHGRIACQNVGNKGWGKRTRSNCDRYGDSQVAHPGTLMEI